MLKQHEDVAVESMRVDNGYGQRVFLKPAQLRKQQLKVVKSTMRVNG